MKPLVPLACLAALTLAACDWLPKKDAPPPVASAAAPAANLPHERAEPVFWDDALGGFMFEGRPLAAGRIWRFEDGPGGFTGQGSTVTFSPIDGSHLINEVYDSLLRSPDGLALEGGRFNLVLARLSRTANGPPWDGSLYWSNDAHGELEAFHARPFLGAAPGLNETVILAYDMSRPVRGGDDWMKSIIRRIRIDTDDGAGGRFLLRQIAIVQNPAPDRLRAVEAAATAPPPAKTAAPSAGLR